MKKLISIIVIIVVVASAICIVQLSHGGFQITPNTNIQSDYVEYKLELTPTGLMNFTLFVPVMVCENDGNLSTVMSQLSLTGSGTKELVNTTHGLALKVQGRNKISIYGKVAGKTSIAWFNMISQETGGGNVKYWVYFNASSGGGIEVHTLGIVSKSGMNYLSSIDKVVSLLGWQELDGVKCIKQP